jgi:hypothetical protein
MGAWVYREPARRFVECEPLELELEPEPEPEPEIESVVCVSRATPHDDDDGHRGIVAKIAFGVSLAAAIVGLLLMKP